LYLKVRIVKLKKILKMSEDSGNRGGLTKKYLSLLDINAKATDAKDDIPYRSSLVSINQKRSEINENTTRQNVFTLEILRSVLLNVDQKPNS
jgi:hypothetical protein